MTKKADIEIKGMSCGVCTKAVEESLLEVQGIKNVLVSLSKNKAFAEVPDNVTKEHLAYKVKEAGYNPGKIIFK